MDERKTYYVIIPACVRYDENLVPSAKLLYGDIAALANEKGYCWATNDYFAKLYKVSKKSISMWIKSLCAAGYIKLEMLHQKDGIGGTVRFLKIAEGLLGEGIEKSSHPIEEKVDTTRKKLLEPQEANFQHNNTFNINSSCSVFEKRYEEKPNRKHKNAFSTDSEPYLLAKLLEQEIINNNPKFPQSEKQKQTWAKDIDLMIRRDKLLADDIAEVIMWCQSDNFWKSNILSGKKLREKYQQLRMKMKSN